MFEETHRLAPPTRMFTPEMELLRIGTDDLPKTTIYTIHEKLNTRCTLGNEKTMEILLPGSLRQVNDKLQNSIGTDIYALASYCTQISTTNLLANGNQSEDISFFEVLRTARRTSLQDYIEISDLQAEYIFSLIGDGYFAEILALKGALSGDMIVNTLEPSLSDHERVLSYVQNQLQFCERLNFPEGVFTYDEIAEVLGISPNVVEKTIRNVPDLTKRIAKARSNTSVSIQNQKPITSLSTSFRGGLSIDSTLLLEAIQYLDNILPISDYFSEAIYKQVYNIAGLFDKVIEKYPFLRQVRSQICGRVQQIAGSKSMQTPTSIEYDNKKWDSGYEAIMYKLLCAAKDCQAVDEFDYHVKVQDSKTNNINIVDFVVWVDGKQYAIEIHPAGMEERKGRTISAYEAMRCNMIHDGISADTYSVSIRTIEGIIVFIDNLLLKSGKRISYDFITRFGSAGWRRLKGKDRKIIALEDASIPVTVDIEGASTTKGPAYVVSSDIPVNVNYFSAEV